MQDIQRTNRWGVTHVLSIDSVGVILRTWNVSKGCSQYTRYSLYVYPWEWSFTHTENDRTGGFAATPQGEEKDHGAVIYNRLAPNGQLMGSFIFTPSSARFLSNLYGARRRRLLAKLFDPYLPPVLLPFIDPSPPSSSSSVKKQPSP